MIREIVQLRMEHIQKDCKRALLEEGFESFETWRKDSFDCYLEKWEKHYENVSKNQRETDRINSQNKIKELHAEIRETWNDAARSLMLEVMAGDILRRSIFIPPLILLIIGQTKASIIAGISAVVILFLCTLPPVSAFITFYIFKQAFWVGRLTSQYTAYGSYEAKIKAADYRGLSRLDERPIITPDTDDAS